MIITANKGNVMKKVGFQGNHGTFSEIAALEYFHGEDIEPVGYHNFVEIMNDLESHKLDDAVLPVENTTTGIISRTYDLFKDYHIHAVGEINVPIRENLIVVPGTKMEEIKEVYSHPEALSQCRRFFQEHPSIKEVPFQDTAKSVEFIKEQNEHAKAALASYRAADYYGMESLLPCVQDSNTNMTRFLVVTWRDDVVEGADKTSLMLVVNHQPGSLYKVLESLARRGINMLKLESRPIVGRFFEYLFYIDVEGDRSDPLLQEAFAEMGENCLELRVFGSYRAASLPK